MSQSLKVRRSIGSIVQIIGRGISYISAAGAFAVIGIQATHWLRDGTWTSWSTADAVMWIALQTSVSPDSESVMSWIYNPTTWLGLHTLVTTIPFALGLFGVGLAGMLLGDWGRTLRVNAERRIWDARQVVAHAGETSSRLRPASTDLPFPALLDVQLSDASHTLERDILRWLSVNDADKSVSTPAAIARHLGKPATTIDAALATLQRMQYVDVSTGAAGLADRGRMFCVEQGWTMRS